MAIDFSLKGKVALVTGAGTGLGQGMAIGLAGAGAGQTDGHALTESRAGPGDERDLAFQTEIDGHFFRIPSFRAARASNLSIGSAVPAGRAQPHPDESQGSLPERAIILDKMRGNARNASIHSVPKNALYRY